MFSSLASQIGPGLKISVLKTALLMKPSQWYSVFFCWWLLVKWREHCERNFIPMIPLQANVHCAVTACRIQRLGLSEEGVQSMPSLQSRGQVTESSYDRWWVEWSYWSCGASRGHPKQMGIMIRRQGSLSLRCQCSDPKHRLTATLDMIRCTQRGRGNGVCLYLLPRLQNQMSKGTEKLECL